MVSAIPPDSNSVIPYLVVPNCDEALSFYERAFGAKTTSKMTGPGGKGVIHAEMSILGSKVMLTEENPQWDMVSAKTLGKSPVSMMFYCEDVDAAFDQAIKAGCEVKFPVGDMFWGDRMGKLQDPFGLQWSIATHVEDVPEGEMDARQKKWFEDMQKGG